MIEEKSQKNFSLNFRLTIGLTAIIFLALLSGVVATSQTNSYLDKKIAEIRESERPADIDIIILQEPSCRDCSNLGPLVDAIKKENVKVNSERVVDASGAEGMELIDKYNIDKVPTLIVSGEIEKDAKLESMWPQMGEVKDGIFILRQVGFPYMLTASGDVRGRVKLIMLTDTSCSECYDVTKHQAILGQFGVPTQDQQVVDSRFSDGQELIVKYKVKLLPTIILTGDLQVYQALNNVWPQVGTIEEDGTYVFREGVKQMGVYKDLATNKIVKPASSQDNS